MRNSVPNITKKLRRMGNLKSPLDFAVPSTWYKYQGVDCEKEVQSQEGRPLIPRYDYVSAIGAQGTETGLRYFLWSLQMPLLPAIWVSPGGQNGSNSSSYA